MLKKINTIALLGASNAGKSTLINFLTNKYVSIITKKPQTTINIITSKLIKKNQSLNLIDLPGFSFEKKLFNQVLNDLITNSFKWSDVFFLISTAEKIVSKAEIILLKKLSLSQKKIYLIITKIDLGNKNLLDQKIKYFQKYKKIEKIIWVSVLKNKNLDLLKQTINPFFKKDFELKNTDISNHNNFLKSKQELFFCKEIIRKSIFESLQKELPYQIYVEIESFSNQENLIKIDALLICAKKSQKKIIIGSKGEKIKQIGIFARKELESYFEKKIYLALFVKVDLNWISNLKTIKKITTL